MRGGVFDLTAYIWYHDMDVNAMSVYQELAERYLRIAIEIAEELRRDENVIGCAVTGSVARGDVHSKSDIDLLVLVKGNGIYEWERRTLQDVVVNIAWRSSDVLERMAMDHPDTIWALKDAQVLYDPQGTLHSLKHKATITGTVEEEFLGDLLDEARSFMGKAGRALAENDRESSLLCLRQAAIKIAERMFYEQRGRRTNPMRFWQELRALSLPNGFKDLFIEIQGFQSIDVDLLFKMLEQLEGFFPKPGR